MLITRVLNNIEIKQFLLTKFIHFLCKNTIEHNTHDYIKYTNNNLYKKEIVTRRKIILAT